MAEWLPLVSCEHGGNRVPPSYEELFHGQQELLQTHRGYDIGILPFARRLARELDAPLHAGRTTRLLVDLNRSSRSSTLFSSLTRQLPPAGREAILRRYYDPYRRQVRETVAGLLAAGSRVVHLSAHSFTPILNGVERRADIGLLYDPKRDGEERFCRLWQEELHRLKPQLMVRRNYPYRGVSDSLVRTLRGIFADGRYLGIEIEINQKLPLAGDRAWQRLQETLIRSLLDHPFFARPRDGLS